MRFQAEQQQQIKNLNMEEDGMKVSIEQLVIEKEECTRMLSLMEKLADKLSK